MWFRKEDWMVVWVGFLIITFSLLGMAKGGLIDTFIKLAVFASLGVFVMKSSFKKFIVGLPVILGVSWVASLVGEVSFLKQFGIETVFWSLVLGLCISNTIGVPSFLKDAVKTEYYIKMGLVLLGAEMIFQTIAKAGVYGIIQALLVIPAVFYVCYYLGKRFGLDDEFSAILGSGVSICGVSAAISAGGAIKGDPKKVSHTISLILLCAVPMIILMPIFARILGLAPAVSGAWIGGTIDTTGAVVAAGEMAGEETMTSAVVVKMAQNAFIGLAAFLLAIWFSLKDRAKKEVSAIEIWYRFPKFIVGFVVASLVFSFLLSPELSKTALSSTKTLRTWWFTLAFVCVGLDTKFKELIMMGKGKPAIVFLSAQVFNIFWTLLIAYIIFGSII